MGQQTLKSNVTLRAAFHIPKCSRNGLGFFRVFAAVDDNRNDNGHCDNYTNDCSCYRTSVALSPSYEHSPFGYLRKRDTKWSLQEMLIVSNQNVSDNGTDIEFGVTVLHFSVNFLPGSEVARDASIDGNTLPGIIVELHGHLKGHAFCC